MGVSIPLLGTVLRRTLPGQCSRKGKEEGHLSLLLGSRKHRQQVKPGYKAVVLNGTCGGSWQLLHREPASQREEAVRRGLPAPFGVGEVLLWGPRESSGGEQQIRPQLGGERGGASWE